MQVLGHTIPCAQVHMQIIRTLLVAVTHEECEVHDHQLLMAVRTCYSIYLTSKVTPRL